MPSKHQRRKRAAAAAEQPSDTPLTASEHRRLEGLLAGYFGDDDRKTAWAEIAKLRAKNPTAYKDLHRRHALSELPLGRALDRAQYWRLKDAGVDRFDMPAAMLEWHLADGSHPSHPQHSEYRRKMGAARARLASGRHKKAEPAEASDGDSQIQGIVRQVKDAVIAEVIEMAAPLLEEMAQHSAHGHAEESDKAASAKMQSAKAEYLEFARDILRKPPDAKNRGVMKKCIALLEAAETDAEIAAALIECEALVEAEDARGRRLRRRAYGV